MRLLGTAAEGRVGSIRAPGLRFVRRVSLPAVVALGFSLLAHAVAVTGWRAMASPPEPYFGFDAVLIALFGCSCLLSVAMFAFDSLAALRAMALLRFLLLIGICNPFGVNLAATLPLLIAAELEICVYDRPPASAVGALALVVGSVAARSRALAASDPAVWAAPIAAELLAGAVVAAAASLMTWHRQRSIDLARELAQLDKAVSDLSEASRGYLRVADAVEAASAREERDRITRELHDTIGYTFTNLIMMMQAAKALASVDPSRLAATLDDASAQAQRGLAETRRVLYLLRDRPVAEPPGLGGIEHLVRTFERATAVKVKVDYANVPARCGEEVESFLYHFIQEGLTNSFRHGRARNIRVKFWREEGLLRVALTDDGSAPDALVEGLGMRGMRERLGKLGGTLEARGLPDGFEVTAEVPLPGGAS